MIKSISGININQKYPSVKELGGMGRGMNNRQIDTTEDKSLIAGRGNKRYVDLFAGLGGFHIGLSRLGHKCVLASELDPELRSIYEENFGLTPEGDIRAINEKLVPTHDVLCAGFPCQPFSRAGKKEGSECPASGKLIDDVFRILHEQLPQYVMLENVPDILTIKNGEFWQYICDGMASLGYEIDFRIYTPQDFGIPQKRKRVFVVASRSGLKHFVWPEPTKVKPSLSNIIDKNSKSKRVIAERKEFVLNKWQDFVSNVNEFSSLPILATEFGATYPYERRIRTVQEMSAYKGMFGQNMRGCKRWADIQDKLPKYSRKNYGLVSYRVAVAVKYSRDLYKRHKKFLDAWVSEIKELPASWLKFEWQGYRDTPDIWQHIIQFRASGIRIIKPDSAPSLVAMSTTQTPILGPEHRYMTVREAAALQSLEMLSNFPKTDSAAYKALGNAVNAHIVNKIAERLII